MPRTYITLSASIHAFLTSESERLGRSVNDLVRQYITDRKEFSAFFKFPTTRSEDVAELAEQLAEAIVRPYIHDLKIDDERRPQLGETVLAYRARLSRSGLVEPRFDTDPPWIDEEV